jgi:MFS family permease
MSTFAPRRHDRHGPVSPKPDALTWPDRPTKPQIPAPRACTHIRKHLGALSGRIGPKRTLLLGLLVIIAGAGLAGMSDSVMGIVGWRALWGLGNALFIATALATIVSSALGSVAQAIILYEAALGLGIAVGPLIGGVLGSISWRGPFFGVSALMAVALVVTAFLCPRRPEPRTPPACSTRSAPSDTVAYWASESPRCCTTSAVSHCWRSPRSHSP